MPKLSHADRNRLWKDRLKRFGLSDQSVAAFCQAEGVSAPSFYQWRRKLAPDKVGSAKSKRDKSMNRRQKADSDFAQLTVVGNDSLPSIIELPSGVRITLGTDQTTIANIVQQLMQLTTDAPNKEASC